MALRQGLNKLLAGDQAAFIGFQPRVVLEEQVQNLFVVSLCFFMGDIDKQGKTGLV